MKSFIHQYILSYKFVMGLFLLAVLFASLQSILLEYKHQNAENHYCTHYNNYLIFKNSHFNLLQDENLYVHHPDQHCDLYKYSPSFALFFGALAYFPDSLGLILWNLLNAMLLLLAIRLLPVSIPIQLSIALFVAMEMTGSMQNEQSNALVAGLLILSFGLFEKDKAWLATLCIALSIYVKLFGLVACCLILLYPNRIKSIGYFCLWMVLIFVLPMLFVSYDELIMQYQHWYELLKMDHANEYNYSVMYGLKAWFGIELDKVLIVAIGVVVFMVSYFKVLIRENELKFRLLILSSVLIWVVIFNHKAESPTFIIALCGIAIWYFIQEKNKLHLALLILAFVLTCLTPTDIFPADIRKGWFKPYIVKSIPSVLIWLKLSYDLIFRNKQVKVS